MHQMSRQGKGVDVVLKGPMTGWGQCAGVALKQRVAVATVG